MENHLTHSADHDALLFAGIPQQDLEVLERSLRQIYQNLQQDMCGVSRENI